jgi:predicted dehydrogenase
VKKAVAAGKHIYAEKPVADTTANATDLATICEAAGVKNGVVQDKLFLPGIIKLKRTIDSGFFGRILSIRGEFGCKSSIAISVVPMQSDLTSRYVFLRDKLTRTLAYRLGL